MPNVWLMGGDKLQKNPTIRPVVAIALRRSDGSIMMQRCAVDHVHAGLWEFPGGKPEEGETPEGALVREASEELGIGLAASDLEPLGFASDPSQDADTRSPYVVLLYTCNNWEGEPEALEADEVGWFACDSLLALPLAPLDRILAGYLAG